MNENDYYLLFIIMIIMYEKKLHNNELKRIKPTT